MSMDDQYREMQRFRDNLVSFNDKLQASMRDLEARHAAVTPHWQDEMRRMYDSHWNPLDKHMQDYLKRQGPAYVIFLKEKIVALGRYLRGN